MTTNIVNQVSYLRTTREFPEDLHMLTVEINKSYVDIANAVNNRTISIFPTNRPALTGESWFFTTSRQQSFRQIFSFTSFAAITHGLPFTSIDRFTIAYGTFTDGTNWYGLIFGNALAPIAGQVIYHVTPTQIIFGVGAGAPAITKGNIVVEWLSQV